MITKKTRTDIVDEINEEMMLFLKDQRYEMGLIFVKKDQFTHLHRLDLRVLYVPAIWAPAERVSSRSGMLIRAHRSRLSKDILFRLASVGCKIDLLS